jgi:N-acetylmuramoyl-L-alanine amidase
MRPLSVALLVLVGACSSAAGGQAPATSSLATESVSTTTLAATTTLPSTTTTTLDPPAETTITQPAEAKAIITPSGVVVAVVAANPSGYLVTTPCGNEQEVSTGTPVGGVRVVLDPGHGGEIDTGAVGSNGLMEKTLNLELAQAVEANLIVRGIPVILTRTGDYASRLGVRTGLADRLGADLLLSVHHNSPTLFPSPRPGTEVFIQSESDESRRLGGVVYDHVVDALADFDVAWTAAHDAGVLEVLSSRGEDAYGINRNAETVSVLTEMGYISNPPEAALFATDAYIHTASEALADAVEEYLDGDATGSGFVAEPRVFDPHPGIGSEACEDPDLE